MSRCAEILSSAIVAIRTSRTSSPVIKKSGAKSGVNRFVGFARIMNTTYSVTHPPRGTTLSCKGWQQEAAMRMLMNNLDEEGAERPKDLVGYGGPGRAARRWG